MSRDMSKTFEFLKAGKNKDLLTREELKAAAVNSLRLIAEEFGELLDAFGDSITDLDRHKLARIVGSPKTLAAQEHLEIDPVEIVDALCDLKVVIANTEYFLGLEEVVERSLDLIEDNNLTKVNVSRDIALESRKMYLQRGIVVEVKNSIVGTTTEEAKYTILNSEGKILKPIGYLYVDLNIPASTIESVRELLEL